MIIRLNAFDPKAKTTLGTSLHVESGIVLIEMPENKMTIVGHITSEGKGIAVTETREQIEALLEGAK